VPSADQIEHADLFGDLERLGLLLCARGQRELFVDGETAVCAHVLQLALLDGETPCRRTGPSRGRDGRIEHHLMREAMARVVKGAEKEVEIMSARSGVLTQTGSTLVERGLYCARPRDYGATVDRCLDRCPMVARSAPGARPEGAR